MLRHEIHACDWRAHLPELPDDSIDVTITDPPYSVEVHRTLEAGRSRTYADEHDRNKGISFAYITGSEMLHLARETVRVTRRWILVFSDLESTHIWRASYEASGAEYVRTCLWVKTNPMPQITGDRPGVGAEAILCFHRQHRPGKRDKKRWNGGGKSGVFPYPIVIARGAGEKRLHETQKPRDLMLELVTLFSDEGETILDPYAGSGTTGVAARVFGRGFVGYERDQNCARIARERIGASDLAKDADGDQFRLF